MFEKVNPSHPDKIADRIAGAIVDLAYKKDKWPKIAVEVLIGHGHCNVIAETSVHFKHTLNRFTGTNIRRVNIMTFSELELVIDTIIDYINYAYMLNHNDYKCLARLLLKELDTTQKKTISDKLDSVYSEKEQQRKQIKEEMGV